MTLTIMRARSFYLRCIVSAGRIVRHGRQASASMTNACKSDGAASPAAARWKQVLVGNIVLTNAVLLHGIELGRLGFDRTLT
jgi:hypothetical protein